MHTPHTYGSVAVIKASSCLKRMAYYQQYCKWALTTVATVSTRDEFFRFLLPILLFCTKAETADWNWFSNRLKRKTDKKSTECIKGANHNAQNHRHIHVTGKQCVILPHRFQLVLTTQYSINCRYLISIQVKDKTHNPGTKEKRMQFQG